MKQTIILLAATLTTYLHSNAQTMSGTIVYDEVMHMNIDLPAEAAQFKDMFPKENHVARELVFSPDATVYQALKGADPSTKKTASSEDGEMRMIVKMDVPQDIIYTDLKDAKLIEQKELLSKKFLITGDLTKRAWHNTGQQKTIAGYACQEAVSIVDTDTVTAWFTTFIPVSSGPMGLGGLPGMILEASQKVGQGMVTVTATKIEEGLNGKDIASVPTKGKRVTKEEFKAIADAKRKEMQQQYGGHGNMIIRIEDK